MGDKNPKKKLKQPSMPKAKKASEAPPMQADVKKQPTKK